MRSFLTTTHWSFIHIESVGILHDNFYTLETELICEVIVTSIGHNAAVLLVNTELAETMEYCSSIGQY